MPSLLVVEDDEGVREGLHLALETLGHQVCTAPSGEQALLAVGESAFDLAIVDVMLPGMDGFELVRRLRETSNLPVLLLTARSDPTDVVVGLECGADDYVVKPSSPRVIDARVKAVLRRVRQPPDAEGVTLVGHLRVDRAAMTVSVADREIPLTPTELRLLFTFLDRSGHALSRRQLLELVWDYGYGGDTRLVDACVQRLRAKVELDSSQPTLIRTVRGVGYRLQRP